MIAATTRILVVGLGASGEACARYCLEAHDLGAEVTVVDADDSSSLRTRAEELRALGATVLLGADDVAGDFDLAVMSPGVPPSAPLFAAARRAALETVSEIEFAYRRSVAPWIAVTGTNGKTTVTSLIGHLLAGAGMPARVVGNIGDPAIAAVADSGPAGVLVAELSSFQLALTDTFHPRVAVLLNITPDHLDWHGDMATYAADKARIFARLDADDTAVICIDDAGSAAYVAPVATSGARVVPVSHATVPEGGAGVDAEGTIVAPGASGPVRLLHRDELPMKGSHNLGNACAAAAAALAFGAAPEAVRVGLQTFQPLEHRLEPVGVLGGVEYYNDSKATNPDAAMKALAAFEDVPLVALLGGRNKGFSFDELAHVVKERAVTPVVFGEAASEIEDALARAGVASKRASGLLEAVSTAAMVAEPGSVVVLSPACASFDEFGSYAERGRAFKDAVTSRTGEDA